MDFAIKLLQSLGVDQTIFPMVGIFLGGYVVARVLGFGTLSKTLTERDERTAGREHKAEIEKKRFADIQSELDAKLKSANAEVSQVFSGIRAEAIAKQNDIIKAAREKGQKEIEKTRDDIETLLKAELLKIKDQAQEMARLIVHQLGLAKSSPKSPTRAQMEA